MSERNLYDRVLRENAMRGGIKMEVMPFIKPEIDPVTGKIREGLTINKMTMEEIKRNYPDQLIKSSYFNPLNHEQMR